MAETSSGLYDCVVSCILKVFSRLTQKGTSDSTPGPSAPSPRASLPPSRVLVSPSPVHGEVCVASCPVRLTAVPQSGQHVHALHHQLQQVTHPAEDATRLRPTQHCGHSMGTVRCRPSSLEATRGRLVSRPGWLRPQPHSYLPRKRRGQERELAPLLTPAGQECREPWANPVPYQLCDTGMTFNLSEPQFCRLQSGALDVISGLRDDREGPAVGQEPHSPPTSRSRQNVQIRVSTSVVSHAPAPESPGQAVDMQIPGPWSRSADSYPQGRGPGACTLLAPHVAWMHGRGCKPVLEGLRVLSFSLSPHPRDPTVDTIAKLS